jgi:hypothetical protein
MDHEVKRLVEEMLDQTYVESGIDWRQALAGEEVALELQADGSEAIALALAFADGTRQVVAAPKPFNPLRCAWSLKAAVDKDRGA